MKKLLIITAILITGFITTAKSETKIINHSGFEFGFFYSNLAPYGSWIELDAGLIVWRPTMMRRGWAPYMQGRWIWTVDGWYWDSYEPFGHIVFHYGRWYFDDYYGWIWIPDYDWAPAWVEWRYDDAYIGWAPLPPYAVFSIHIGIHYTHNYYVPYHHWHYVNYNNFCDPYVYNHYVAPKYKYRIHNRTKVRNNYAYRDGRIVNRGVDIDYVRKRSGQNIRQRDIVRVNDYKEIEKYRNKNEDVVRTFVPSRDELTRDRNISDVKIERKNNRTSLDVSKVRLGREDVKGKDDDIITNKERAAVRDKETKKIDINERKNSSDVKRNVEVRKNESANIDRKKDVELIPEKKVERKNVQKNEINIQRNNEVKQKIETKQDGRNNGVVEQQRYEVEKKRTNNPVNTKVERKVEVKRESSNNNRNYEQPKRENKIEIKTETKQDNPQPKVKTQDRSVEKNNNTNNTGKRSR